MTASFHKSAHQVMSSTVLFWPLAVLFKGRCRSNAATHCLSANKSSANSPGCRKSISSTSALLYRKPGLKIRSTAFEANRVIRSVSQVGYAHGRDYVAAPG